MSKRFIDTGIFDDDWFMDLSKEAKLLWIYCITKCDHAGLIKINPKLCGIQTDIKDLDGTIKQLGNRLVTVSERLYFIPKFIEFQYPGFPNSKVRQQQSAVEILQKHNLFDENKLTISKLLTNSYGNDNDNVNVIEGGVGETINIPFETFWNLYGKKQDRIKCEGKWKRLSNKDRKACIDAIPAYVKSTPDIQYRKNPATYLNNKSWENEVGVITKPTPSNPTQNYINPNWVDDRICKR